MADFAVGDVVRLKDGGPEMTVTRALDAEGDVRVTWDEGGEDKGSTNHKLAELVLVRTAEENLNATLDEITAEPPKTGMLHPDFLPELEKHANRPEPRTPTNRNNLAGRLFGNKPRP